MFWQRGQRYTAYYKGMIDPLMGGTGMRGNFVTFVTEKTGKEVAS